MEKESLTKAMKSSISEVLETMFFLPLDFSDSANKKELWETKRDQVIAAKLNFDGPYSGYCAFFLPKNIAVSLASDFMGMDEDSVSDDQVFGTVMEITNMISGNTFSLYDTQTVFNLRVPEMVKSNDYLEKIFKSESECFVVIDTLEDHLAFQVVVTA